MERQDQKYMTRKDIRFLIEKIDRTMDADTLRALEAVRKRASWLTDEYVGRKIKSTRTRRRNRPQI